MMLEAYNSTKSEIAITVAVSSEGGKINLTQTQKRPILIAHSSFQCSKQYHKNLFYLSRVQHVQQMVFTL